MARASAFFVLAAAGLAATTARAFEPAARPQSRTELRANIARQAEYLWQKSFRPRRIKVYQAYQGKHLDNQLAALRPGQHLIEIGPGEEPVLARHYLLTYGRARVTTIGLEPVLPAVESELSQLARSRGTSYEHKSGRPVESYQRGEIELGDYVLDQYAAMAYTDRPHRLIAAEGELVRQDGFLQTTFGARTRIVDRHGRDCFLEWANSFEGLKLIYHEHTARGHMAIWLRSDGAVRAPPLARKRFVSGGPPRREFVWDGRRVGARDGFGRRAKPAYGG
jgi:hypothetical protein